VGNSSSQQVNNQSESCQVRGGVKSGFSSAPDAAVCIFGGFGDSRRLGLGRREDLALLACTHFFFVRKRRNKKIVVRQR
jgi:hypothetical protein